MYIYIILLHQVVTSIQPNRKTMKNQSTNFETKQMSQGRSMGLQAFVLLYTLYTFDVAKPASSTEKA